MDYKQKTFDFAPLLPPAQRHSETSREAADAIEPKADTLRRLVLDFIRSRGDQGATDEECQDALGMAGSTQRPRRVELQNLVMVMDSGRTRKTHSGRNAVIWIAVRKP